MKRKVSELYDYIILLAVLILVTLGILFIYSSAINSEGVCVTNEYVKQIIWAGIGLFMMILISFYDYRRLQRVAYWLYIAFGILLLYTKFFGRYVNGARSWLGIGDFGIQPSEFCKVIFILTLSKYLTESRNEKPLRRFIIAMGIMALPCGLILLQPDLGTATVYIPVFFVMCFMAGIPVKFIGFVLLMGVSTIFFAILPVWNSEIEGSSHRWITILTNMKLRIVLIMVTTSISLIGVVVRRYFHGKRYFFWIAYFFIITTLGLIFSMGVSKVLKEYQIMRLIIFMDPNVDPLGSGWNIIQSKIAIGSGRFLGRGYLNGSQSHYRFLPEQSTDFIFSILSEEFGFIGGMVVYFLYFVIFVRLIQLMKNLSNNFGLFIVSGVLAMFSFHFFINVGMVMGIMPITGIPLLFLSYGGSSLLTSMICIGLVMNIYRHKKDLY